MLNYRWIDELGLARSPLAVGDVPFKLAICGLEELPQQIGRFRATHAISICDPNVKLLPAFHAATTVLRLGFWDAPALPAGVAQSLSPHERDEYPSLHHARTLLHFGSELPDGARVLIHCWAGISRSTAAAFLLLCQRMPGRERAALKMVCKLRKGASPNRMLVGYGDQLLGADGRMLAALDDKDVGKKKKKKKRQMVNTPSFGLMGW